MTNRSHFLNLQNIFQNMKHVNISETLKEMEYFTSNDHGIHPGYLINECHFWYGIKF